MTAVTFALPSESSDFIALLQHPRRTGSDQQMTVGSLGGERVCVLHTGVGEKSTRSRIAPFLREEKPHRLISAGFAGALVHDLAPAELLLAQNFSAPDFLAEATTSLAGARLRVGNLTTIGSVVHSTAGRAEIAAMRSAIAADMETDYIAAACAEKDLPMLSLRAISDTPDAPFPAPPEILFDVEQQRTQTTRLLFYVALHPGTLVRLMRFMRQITAARRALANALRLVISRSA